MKPNSAGALLFGMIFILVTSLLVSGLVILTTNQYRMMNREIEQKRAFYRAQAGMEYAIWQAYSNASWLPAPNSNVNYNNISAAGGNVNIRIQNPDPDNQSSYKIWINARYES